MGVRHIVDGVLSPIPTANVTIPDAKPGGRVLVQYQSTDVMDEIFVYGRPGPSQNWVQLSSIADAAGYAVYPAMPELQFFQDFGGGDLIDIWIMD